ncbi:Uncharacterized protein SCF082_LOCUS39977 [Durusdinium trenchii]|uniref:Sushi domain-containing protein n=1 Tax=Durusdinium trenchii TaxID=1381693 RepID=A0ABP0Q7N3_9DINO
MGLSPQDQSSAILIHAMRQQEFLVRSAFQSFRREVSFSPATFQCVPNPCPIPTVKNRLGNGCRGVAGSSVESGKSCKASCKSGYTPSVKQLDCYAETLTPETFVCEPNPCSIPVDSNQEGSGCLGVPGQKDGTVIEHGETCQSECKEGYHPSVESMSCSLGTLSPAKWSCIEDACPAVEGVANAPKVTCKEGNSINSQKSCTTKCRDGYKPNYASLTCRLGKFFPHTYICEPEGCPLPVVKNRLTSGCSGLPHPAVVTSGQSCSAQCDNGYTPSVASLKCFAGKLTPATFVCNEDPCDAPGGIQNGATESCKEGKEIASGDKCTSQCAAGYVPSTAQLSCSLGKLTPSFYSCNPEPCTLPQFANRKGNGCKSKSGQTVASGETCTAECAAGYTPNELSLKCYAGVLTPATFSCFPDPCPLPSISKAQGNGCSNLGGSMIDSGLKCEAACQTGYTPSVKVLACQASILTPDTFTCNPNGCTLPKVQNQAGNGCQGIKGSSIGSGKTCKTQCAAGFTPDVESLSCFAEELTPSTFTCNPTPCTLPAVANAQGNGCKGKVGTVIASGATCKTACMPGYEASEDKLECSAGSLSPATFACAELKCRAPTGIPHAPHVGCAEGRTIKGGKTCTPRCNSGYSPSAASLACKQGVFEPTSYGCLPGSCSIPQISNAASPKCEQGDTIKHGQKCTPKCKPNYIPSNSGLTCTAGNLEPTTFTCKAPCASPNVANAAQPCKEGNLIEHGKSCSSQCDVGFSATSGSLECNDGQLCLGALREIDMPESGSNFYNCWSGDPHFTCRGGRRSDPLVPGTHWVLKQACPNSPNFMWVQGVYGPVSPSGAMATAFGGMFLGKNILTIRSLTMTMSGAKYVYDLYGTELSVYMNGNKIEAGLGRLAMLGM